MAATQRACQICGTRVPSGAACVAVVREDGERWAHHGCWTARPWLHDLARTTGADLRYFADTRPDKEAGPVDPPTVACPNELMHYEVGATVTCPACRGEIRMHVTFYSGASVDDSATIGAVAADAYGKHVCA